MSFYESLPLAALFAFYKIFLLFPCLFKFRNNENDINPIIDYIDNLAKNKVPIYRGYISLREFDAERLGYYEQEKWKNLLENRLPSIAKKMNIKLEDLQYLGAVHMEDGHPHLQFFVWSKKPRINFCRIVMVPSLTMD